MHPHVSLFLGRVQRWEEMHRALALTVLATFAFNFTTEAYTAEITFLTLAGQAGKYGDSDGAGATARFGSPTALAIGDSNTLWVADSDNHAIRRVDSDGRVTTFAGAPGQSGYADGPGSKARFDAPSGIAAFKAGDLLVADTGNHLLRRIDLLGNTTTFAGKAGEYGAIDGTGLAARFHTPTGVAVDGAGVAYVADYGNHTIRRVEADGRVSTLSGVAGQAGSDDGTGVAARWNHPAALALDLANNIWVADYANHTVRRIDASGKATLWAGLPGQPGSADGQGPSARFNYPAGVATDSSGNLYIADSWNHALRRIDPSGRVETIGGLAGSPGGRDGTGATARFYSPQGVAADGAKRILVADTYNYRILTSRPACPDTPVIDAAEGPVGLPRQLDTAPRTAEAWAWAVLARPLGSTATLSAQDRPNPAFVPDALGNYLFRLGVTNATGEVAIRTVQFTATEGSAPLTITRQLSSQTVHAGESAEFVVLANGAPPLAYSWSKDGTILVGQTNYVFALPRAEPRDAGTYAVTVTDARGTSRSSTATLSVTGPTVVTGLVSDGRTGQPLSGVQVRVGQASTETDARGHYALVLADLGEPKADFDADRQSGMAPLTVQFWNRSIGEDVWLPLSARREGYHDVVDRQSLVHARATNRCDIPLLPVIEGGLMFVLTWGSQPRDLDAHLLTPEVEGREYEVRYGDSERGASNAAPFALLDRDSKQGFGPEIITVYRAFPGTYRFFVHNYQEEQGDTGAIAESGAVVQVLQADRVLGRFTAPKKGSGTYWEVCSFDASTGELIPIDTIANVKPSMLRPFPLTTRPLSALAKRQELPPNRAARTEATSSPEASYFWDFGDGSFSSEPTPAPKTYAAAGSYSVSLSVSNRSGEVMRVSRPSFIIVSAAGPTLAIHRLRDGIQLSWSTEAEGAVVEACESFPDPAWHPILPQPIANGVQGVVLPPTNRATYFRLKKTPSLTRIDLQRGRFPGNVRANGD